MLWHEGLAIVVTAACGGVVSIAVVSFINRFSHFVCTSNSCWLGLIHSMLTMNKDNPNVAQVLLFGCVVVSVANGQGSIVCCCYQASLSMACVAVVCGVDARADRKSCERNGSSWSCLWLVITLLSLTK